MSIQTIREFTGRHYASSAGLAALAAALQAKANGSPLDPTIAARIQDLLAALGAADLLEGLSADEARALSAEVRQNLRFDAVLMSPEAHGSSWSYADPRLLQDVGDFSRSHATMMTKMIIPSLDGVATRFAAPGAKHLDIGTGVAGTAITLAEQWPQVQVVGIDVWQPALALARTNVDRAGLRDRIELREQGVEHLEDERAFDLAWLPMPFIPERVVPTAFERTFRALRPGAWLIVPFIDLEGIPPVPTALWRLRMAFFGGPSWTTAEVEQRLCDKGFTEVKTLPRHPGVPAAFAVGRRPAGS